METRLLRKGIKGEGQAGRGEIIHGLMSGIRNTITGGTVEGRERRLIDVRVCVGCYPI